MNIQLDKYLFFLERVAGRYYLIAGSVFLLFYIIFLYIIEK